MIAANMAIYTTINITDEPPLACVPVDDDKIVESEFIL